MKKVLLITAEEDFLGGGEYFLLDLVWLLKEDNAVTCLCRVPGKLLQALNDHGIDTVYTDARWPRRGLKLIGNHLRVLKMLSVLKKNGCDLIYANSTTVNKFAAVLAARLGVPLVTGVHALFDTPEKDKYAFKQSKRIITCSRAVADLVKKYNNNVDVVYNGVDDARFYPPFAGTFKKDFVVGNIGVLTPKKGWLDFIEAARLVVRDIPWATFTVAGAPKPGEEIFSQTLKDKVKEYSLEENFNFIEQFDPADLLRGFDVLLFSSYFEAFSRVIVEAFASKVAVIACRIGGPAEIIDDDHNGILVPPQDPAAMAAAVKELYDSPDRRQRLCDNAYRKYQQLFTLEKMRSGLRRVFSDLL